MTFRPLPYQRNQGPGFLEAFDLRDYGVEKARRVLRLAALLHDLDHPPFSHTPEELHGTDHEQFTLRILRATEVRSIIEESHHDVGIRIDNDIAPVAVSEVGPARSALAQLYNETLTAVFGADGLDYLLRDSHHVGVMYGRFDAQRLIHTLTLWTDPDTSRPVLAVDVGRVHAAEGLILARNFMPQQGRHHPIRRIYDYHLLQFLREILPNRRSPYVIDEYLDGMML